MFHFVSAIVLAVSLASPSAPSVERSPIPRDHRPDFTPLRSMIGAWDCSVLSSRRPHAFPMHAVTSLSSDGYWLVTTATTPSVPWNRITIKSSDYVTYDFTRARWIDITMDDYGLYGFSTSHDARTWNDTEYPTSHATARHLPRTLTISNDRTYSTIASFEEPNGQRFTVRTTCKKVR